MPRIYVGACNPKPGTQASTPAPLPCSHFRRLFAFRTLGYRQSKWPTWLSSRLITEKLRLEDVKTKTHTNLFQSRNFWILSHLTQCQRRGGEREREEEGEGEREESKSDPGTPRTFMSHPSSQVWGLGDSLAPKIAGCCSRGPVFDSQPLHGVSYPSVTPFPEDLLPFSGPCRHQVHW